MLSWKHRAFALFLAFFPTICHAVLVNRTIDSNLGDPTTNFLPIYHATPGSDEWDDQTCTKCNINPDPAAAFDGTWMSATYFPHGQPLEGINITLQFTGVAIWVFFILSNTNVHGNPFVTTNCNFTLDGQRAGSFSHEPDSASFALQYNVPIFHQTGLSNTPHELIVSVNDFPIPTWLCFDYAIYTSQTDDTNSNTAISSPTSTSPSSTGDVSSTSTPVASSSASKSSKPGDPPTTTSSFPSVASSTPSNLTTLAASQPTSKTRPKIGLIIGCVIGAISLIIIAAVVLTAIRRHWLLLPAPVPIAFRNSGSTSTPAPSNTNNSQRALVRAPPASNDASYASSSRVARSPVGSGGRREKGLEMHQAETTDQSQSALSQREMRQQHETAPAGQDIASLQGQIRELRSQVELIQYQQQPDGTLVSTGGQSAPPPYR